MAKYVSKKSPIIGQARAAGSAAVTSSAAATIVDTKAAENSLLELRLKISAIVINDNDELYKFQIQLSNSATFASGIYVVSESHFGAAEVLTGDADSVVGQYFLPFNTNYAGTDYRYVRVNLIISGTTPSVTYSADIASLE